MRWIALILSVSPFAAFAATTAFPAVQTDPRDFQLRFETARPGTGAIDNPGVLVGFNPQPDPPAFPLAVDVSNSLLPAVQTPSGGAHAFRFVFGLANPSIPGVAWSFNLVPQRDFGSFGFDAQLGSSFVVHVVAHPTSSDGARFDPGSLVGFNPQPDPPAFGAIGFDFSFTSPAVATFSQLGVIGDVVPFARIDFQMTDINGNLFSFTPVPLPATLPLLLFGSGGLFGMRRRGTNERFVCSTFTPE